MKTENLQETEVPAAGPAQHTPGPWIHVPRARDGHVDRITTEGGREFVHVGSPECERPILDVQTANAWLIAAAPDLLAALRELVEIGRTVLSPVHDSGAIPGRRDHDALVDAVAAIAKATGGAQ